MPDRFRLQTRVHIHPAGNTALEGLYQSGEMLCTQCEAEGFRRITYFLDRPDVMARYGVTLAADRRASRCCCPTAIRGRSATWGTAAIRCTGRTPSPSRAICSP